MKKIILILTMLVSIQAFSQTETNLYSEKEIDMILDTNYVFFILNDSVYSESFSTGYKGIVTACKYIRYESKLSKRNINSAFNYFKEWWNYDPEYSKSTPNKNNLHQDIKNLLFSNNEYSKIIDAVIVMRSEIFKEKYTKIEKSNLFIKNAKIVGFPENKIPVNNPFSDDYDILGSLDLSMAYGNIRLDAKSQRLDAKLAEAKARVEKANRFDRDATLKVLQNFYRTTGKNPAEEFDWYEDWAKEYGITLEDLKQK